MNFFFLSLICVLSSCGQNPHLKVRPKIETIKPEVNPIKLEAELILREKNSKRESFVDFGKIKKGETAQKIIEVINIGNNTATEVTLPQSLSSFSIQNLNCEQTIEARKKCQLLVTLNGNVEGIQKDDLEVIYGEASQSNEKPPLKKTSALILGEVQGDIPLNAKIIFTPKNFRSGLIHLKDVPVLASRRIELELKNVGEVEVKGLKLSEIIQPFKLIKTDCGNNLHPDQFCEVIINYQSPTVSANELEVRASSMASGHQIIAIQTIRANSIKLNNPAKLEVEDAVIHRDIFKILGIDPQTLSPFHEVRGLDVGLLKQGNPINFLLKLKNTGHHPAVITKLRHLTGAQFKYTNDRYPGTNGNCSNEVEPGPCQVEINVNPIEMNNIYDVLEYTYLDGHGNTRRLSILLFASVGQRELVECKKIPARESSVQREIVRLKTNNLSYKLPYKLTSASTGAQLQLLYNTESNSSVRSLSEANTQIPIVKNAMVQFGFAIRENELKKYPSARIEFDIFKIGTEGTKFDTTEVLCLNENRKCSGTFFIDNRYGALKTPNYSIQSNQFSTELTGSVIENVNSLRNIFSTTFQSGLIENSANYNTFRLRKRVSLYDLFGTFSTGSDGLNFILADDSMLLSRPNLILEDEFSKCPE